jgi:hypothetical protein
MRRRKQMPPELQPAWDAFRAQALRVEHARTALLSCLPVGRVDPVPVPVGLDLIRDELTAAAGEMASWRHDAITVYWDACAAAIDEALAAIPKASHVATASTELEELLDAVSDVVEPLDAWHDAERAWLRLRRGG